MKNIRNILLIGATGQGKSSLANTLVNKNGEFEEIFGESAGSISKTKDYLTEIFGENGINYRVIDTIGIGDTTLSANETLTKLAAAAFELEDGLNRVFFVINKRVDDKALEVLEILSQTIFDPEIVKYCTVIKTGFPDFEDEDICRRDLEDLRETGEIGSKIVEKVGEENVVYIDNPPLKGRPSAKAVAKETREIVRQKLLEHLSDKTEIYKPDNLAELNQRIKKHTDEVEKEIRKTKKELNSERKSEYRDDDKITELENKLKYLEQMKEEQMKEEARNFMISGFRNMVARTEQALMPIFGTNLTTIGTSA